MSGELESLYEEKKTFETKEQSDAIILGEGNFAFPRYYNSFLRYYNSFFKKSRK